MLQLVKTALRISGTAFDDELQMLIDSCIQELQAMNVRVVTVCDDATPYSPQVQAAVVAYCKWQFGNLPEKEQWRDIYHTKLAQLKTMTGFTNWRR